MAILKLILSAPKYSARIDKLRMCDGKCGLAIGAAYQAAMISTRCCALCFFERLAQREEAPAPVVFQAKKHCDTTTHNGL